MHLHDFPLVTIGLPVYNGAPEVSIALESLVNQAYQNIRIIISDNASTDGTLAICEKFAEKDSRITIIKKTENEGAVENFRTVLNAADSEFFMWAAADDYWHPGFIDDLLPVLRSNPEAGVAMCAVERQYPDGPLYDVVRFNGELDPNGMGNLWLNRKILSGKKFNLFIYGLFRTKMLQRAMRHFPEVLGGDRQFICQLALSFQFAYLDKVLLIRTYQPKNAESYLNTLAENGAIRKQLMAFTKMIVASETIPFWRKLHLPWMLVLFLSFNFLQKMSNNSCSRYHLLLAFLVFLLLLPLVGLGAVKSNLLSPELAVVTVTNLIFVMAAALFVRRSVRLAHKAISYKLGRIAKALNERGFTEEAMPDQGVAENHPDESVRGRATQSVTFEQKIAKSVGASADTSD